MNLPLENTKMRLLLHMREVKGSAKLCSGSYFHRRSHPTCIMGPLILSSVLSTSDLTRKSSAPTPR